MSLNVKVSGIWKSITELYVKTSGNWVRCIDTYVKVGGVWKSVFYEPGSQTYTSAGTFTFIWRPRARINT